MLKRLNSKKIFLFLFSALVVGAGLFSFLQKDSKRKVLVFSKTAGFRHESISSGIAAIVKLGSRYNFSVDTTENAGMFNEENLKTYNAIIFLNTTGDVLNQQQQNDFERYIQAGGGFVGIHAATDTEYDWPWFGKLVGAYFNGHPNNPNVKQGEFLVVDKNHPSTDSLPHRWKRVDEFYNFKEINPDIKVLVKIDEKSYQGGTNGNNHPMSWYHEFDGGRAFYTNMGHTNETYNEPLFLKHLAGGIQYVMGEGYGHSLDYSVAKTKRVPEENRFTKVILASPLDEPMELALLPGGKVLLIERKGAVKIYDPAQNRINLIATIPVSTKYTSGSEAEDGLLGLALDPDFVKNNWIYLYYSQVGEDPKNILTRYELRGDKLIEESKKVLLEVKVQRDECCHTGGSIAFDSKRNLYLTTGDNTNPFNQRGYSPIDERPGKSTGDAQRSSANTNDLRGKILRIHPEADGTYTIPDGNLFSKDNPKSRPEIYTMGHRNPFRISVDKKTGYVYWGEVGPDARADSFPLGPMGYDEINQAKKPGNFGWPYFIGDNKNYSSYNFETTKIGKGFNPEKPFNNSPNNTGMKEIPRGEKAMIWYPYDLSKEFPLVGSGGRTAMAGPVFYSEDFKNTERAFPDYYNGKLFIYEWMRGWIMAVTFDRKGNYQTMERFMPSHRFSNPMDMEFSEEGDLYILEYGTSWFMKNEDARLVKIQYNAGNRKPLVKINASKKKGAVPMNVKFSSEGTIDFDKDILTYEWKIQSKSGTTIKTLIEPNPSFTFSQAGIYYVSLIATDAKGEKSEETLEIHAGNEPPVVSFDIIKGNKTFFFPGQAFNYKVKVNDQEDGSLEKGTILAHSVAVTIDYLKQGFDKNLIAMGHRDADAAVYQVRGQKLVEDSDCNACHNVEKKSIGPTYKAIAEKYKNNPEETERLSRKVINGGSGVWGEVAMAAHPTIKVEEATEMVNYILSFSKEKAVLMPVSGNYMPTKEDKPTTDAVYIMRASYTDRGAGIIPRITSEEIITLRSPYVSASSADEINILNFVNDKKPTPLTILSGPEAYIAYKNIDLTEINAMDFVVIANEEIGNVGGKIEIRIGSPGGTLIGESGNINPVIGEKHSITTAKILPTQGEHDLFLVFKNEKAERGKSLFSLSTLYLKTSENLDN